MYNKVVVPLDGSKLAEEVIPHLEELAKVCSIPEILLVSVTEKVKGRILQSQAFERPVSRAYGTPVRVGMVQTGLIFSTHVTGMQEIPVTLGKMAKTAYNYLRKIGERLDKKGLKTTINVLMGNPAEEIIRFVESQEADLIIMASRGKSGFNRWDMGSGAPEKG